MITIVSHDAGAAEVLSSYARRERLACQYVLEGPARKIFERKLGLVESLPLEQAIETCDSILCGTGWQSDLEHDAIRLARNKRKHSTAYLDHWVNYRERFVRRGETILPSALWVGDAFAYELAKRQFPETPLELIDNPYFRDLESELRDAAKQQRRGQRSGLSVLYVCEPVREHGLLRFGNELHWGYTEEEALTYFLRNIMSIVPSCSQLVLRLHPSEPAGKYDEIIRTFALPFAEGGICTLVEEVASSDVVVGCNSMALVVGLLARKRVISCIPPGGEPCLLPQPQIESAQHSIEVTG